MIATAMVFFRLAYADFSTGDDLREVQNVNQEQCEEICELDKRCAGYVLNPASKRCWLKSSLKGIKRIDLNARSGIKAKDVSEAD